MNCIFCPDTLKISNWVAHCHSCTSSTKDYYISYLLDSNKLIETCLISHADAYEKKFSVDLDMKNNNIIITTWEVGPLFDAIYYPPIPTPSFKSLAHLMEITEQIAQRFNKLKSFI